MQALIDILKEEKVCIERIDFYDESSRDFVKYAETKRAGYNPETCIRLRDKYRRLADDERQHLNQIRKKLAHYMSDLMEYMEEE